MLTSLRPTKFHLLWWIFSAELHQVGCCYQRRLQDPIQDSSFDFKVLQITCKTVSLTCSLVTAWWPHTLCHWEREIFESQLSCNSWWESSTSPSRDENWLDLSYPTSNFDDPSGTWNISAPRALEEKGDEYRSLMDVFEMLTWNVLDLHAVIGIIISRFSWHCSSGLIWAQNHTPTLSLCELLGTWSNPFATPPHLFDGAYPSPWLARRRMIGKGNSRFLFLLTQFRSAFECRLLSVLEETLPSFHIKGMRVWLARAPLWMMTKSVFPQT